MRWEGPAAGASEHWPASYAPLAFGLAFTAGLLLSGVIAVVASVAGADVGDGPPGVTIAGTLALDGALIAVVWLLASRRGHVRPRDFGLTRLSLRSFATWTGAALLAWYSFNLLYSAVFSPSGKQDTLDAMGANDGIALLLVTTAFVVLIAPVVEEIFFRGFCYRALRNRLGRWSAAALVGIVFGSIHYSGPETLALIAPLAVLGTLFCLLYERTGSLYPAIAFHVINNAIALAVTAEASAAPLFAAITATFALTACAVLSRSPSPASSP